MTIDVVLLALLLAAVLGTVMAGRLLRAAIGLALSSAVLSVLLFRLDAPMAAAFELSVCAGLIPALFLSAISMTQQNPLGASKGARSLRKLFFVALPVLMILAGLAVVFVHRSPAFVPPAESADVRLVLWGARHLDLLGQILILLGGTFGVVILVRELRNDQ